MTDRGYVIRRTDRGDICPENERIETLDDQLGPTNQPTNRENTNEHLQTT